MKKILIIFLSFISFLGFSQTGPGGVGNSTTNLLWYDASQEVYLDNASVNVMTDFSGNANNATQATGANQPTYRLNQINTRPSFNFDGVNDRLIISSHITTNAISAFVIFEKTSTSNGGFISFNKHNLFALSNKMNSTYEGPKQSFGSTFNLGDPTIYQFNTTSSSTSGSFRHITANAAGVSSTTQTRTNLLNRPTSTIGTAVKADGSFTLPLNGKISEIIVYNKVLSNVERRIVNNYLGGKYNIPSIALFYAHVPAYGNEIVGLGRETDGSVTSARGEGNLLISNASSLNNGDYILIGNDAAGYEPSMSVPLGLKERWNQVWRVDLTGTPGTISTKFFVGDNPLIGLTSDYTLLIDNDGNFSNGGTTQLTGTYSVLDESVTFTGVSFSDGDYFTLAIEDRVAIAVTDGSWKTPSTWDCNCIPDENYTVRIASPFEVILDSNARANTLTIDNGGNLLYNSDDTLDIELDFTNNGNINFDGLGTLMASGSETQEFINNSSTPIAVNNLYVLNTSDGLNITDGGWSVTNNLQVSSGTLNVTGTDSMILVSDASMTSQILPSVSGAFAGTFRVERFISNRNTDFANISSPITTATFADLDDEIFMSGIGGNDGDAIDVNGNTFYSAYGYFRFAQTYDTITSTTESMNPGEGYEIYLGTSASTYTQGGFSFEGTPNSGTIVAPVIEQGFNLVGNPYHSFIDFDQTDKSNIDDVYYIYNASTGSYTTFSGLPKPPIAASQAYWINKSSFGAASYDFEETDKTDNTSSSYVRKKNSREYSILLKNSEDQLHHEFSIKLNPSASKERDQLDIVHLPSPHKFVPQIYSMAANSETHLSTSALNLFDESQLIPINISAQESAELVIETKNFDNLSKEYSCMYLKDQSTEEVIDLNIESSYAFKTDNNNNRFSLILSNSYTDCQKLIESNSSVQEVSHKIDLRNANGTYYLDYQLKDELQSLIISVYNMNGQLVKGDIQFTASGDGYFRLNHLEGLEGMYLIQVKGKDLFLNKTIKL